MGMVSYLNQFIQEIEKSGIKMSNCNHAEMNRTGYRENEPQISHNRVKIKKVQDMSERVTLPD